LELKTIRSVSFDASFLLRPYSSADKIIKMLRRDGISGFITSTVVSELEQLKV
jgi:rRNA-processing protein FCF1